MTFGEKQDGNYSTAHEPIEWITRQFVIINSVSRSQLQSLWQTTVRSLILYTTAQFRQATLWCYINV